MSIFPRTENSLSFHRFSPNLFTTKLCHCPLMKWKSLWKICGYFLCSEWIPTNWTFFWRKCHARLLSSSFGESTSSQVIICIEFPFRLIRMSANLRDFLASSLSQMNSHPHCPRKVLWFPLFFHFDLNDCSNIRKTVEVWAWTWTQLRFPVRLTSKNIEVDLMWLLLLGLTEVDWIFWIEFNTWSELQRISKLRLHMRQLNNLIRMIQ